MGYWKTEIHVFWCEYQYIKDAEIVYFSRKGLTRNHLRLPFAVSLPLLSFRGSLSKNVSCFSDTGTR